MKRSRPSVCWRSTVSLVDLMTMPRLLLVALIALVAAPLALLGWVSATSYRQQQRQAKEQVQGLLVSRLHEIDNSLKGVLDSYSRRITSSLIKVGSHSGVLRDLKLGDPVVRQTFLVSDSGVLVYPLSPVSDQPDDIALYAALKGIVDARPQFESPAGVDAGQRSERLRSRSAPAQYVPQEAEPQWQVWYMDEGSQLILWLPRSDGATIGVLLERVFWVSELTALLPDTRPSDSEIRTMPGFTALVDESQQIVYRWGENGSCLEIPTAQIALSSPLSSWRLEFHATAELIGPANSTGLVASLVGIGVVVLSLGIFVLTNVRRQMREAESRVSFAGQVSHELRTPLTNIRLYAELAEIDVESLEEGPRREKLIQRLDVIDSESRRLSRLVSGVLEMIQSDRKQRGPRMTEVVPDDVIDLTIDQFLPSFRGADLEVNRRAGATKLVHVDVDIIEMVLVNLLSNVEKYAADGKEVSISSMIDAESLVIDIIDNGPGIPRRKHRAVFRPFSRLDHSIRAPSGTGIGLTIARRAARRHGGELRLIPTVAGAHFRLTIPVKCHES